jgi:hypothetical protein
VSGDGVYCAYLSILFSCLVPRSFNLGIDIGRRHGVEALLLFGILDGGRFFVSCCTRGDRDQQMAKHERIWQTHTANKQEHRKMSDLCRHRNRK